MTKELVDNSGRGNCMYYAYSISLMYFLLEKRDHEFAEQIFTKLLISEPRKSKLHALLDDPERINFTHQQLTTVIEPILGNATRSIVAEQAKEELIHSLSGPTLQTSTPLLTVLDYGLLYVFRLEL